MPSVNKNGQTHVKNLAANIGRSLTCVLNILLTPIYRLKIENTLKRNCLFSSKYFVLKL